MMSSITCTCFAVAANRLDVVVSAKKITFLPPSFAGWLIRQQH